MSAFSALNRLYPHRLMLPKEGIDSVSNLFKSLDIDVPKAVGGAGQRIVSINRETTGTSTGRARINPDICILIGILIELPTT